MFILFDRLKTAHIDRYYYYLRSTTYPVSGLTTVHWSELLIVV